MVSHPRANHRLNFCCRFLKGSAMRICAWVPWVAGWMSIGLYASAQPSSAWVQPAGYGGRPPKLKVWRTHPDGGVLLQRQKRQMAFRMVESSGPAITVDPDIRYQTVDGFGYTFTGGSAWLISQMKPAAKKALLKKLFSRDREGLGISYLRISLGASDLSNHVFSYNDLPSGQTDTGLQRFSLGYDTLHLIPILREIRAVSPELKIMATPWSAPVWMKTNGQSVGGSLHPGYYDVYARYFVRYVEAMQSYGIAIDAVTVQNEPMHGGNNPSMLMTAAEQALFVKQYLGPAFREKGLSTKIIIWDHNADHPEYPISILNDAAAKPFIDGTAFHLYAGDIGAMMEVHLAHPDKNLYFTEQWTGSDGKFGDDLRWHIRNVLIGSLRNRSRAVLEWNLASDPDYGPHTPGGCTQCKAAITISGSSVSRNVSYYIIGHASRFVPPGSVCISGSGPEKLPAVAFLTPEGKKVLIVLNDDAAPVQFQVVYRQWSAPVNLSSGEVVTLTW